MGEAVRGPAQVRPIGDERRLRGQGRLGNAGAGGMAFVFANLCRSQHPLSLDHTAISPATVTGADGAGISPIADVGERSLLAPKRPGCDRGFTIAGVAVDG